MMPGVEVDVERRHRVRSADEVVIELPLAGPTSRMLAYAVDLVTMLAIGTLVLALAVTAGTTWDAIQGWLAVLFESVEADPSGGGLVGFVVFLVVLGLVAEIAYFVAWELAASGQSPGKRLLGLRVVRDGGLPITPWASLVRNVLRSVDQFPSGYVTGLIAIVLSPQAKRLGDLAAGTIVTRLDHGSPAPPLPTIEAARVEAVRLTTEQVARLDADALHLARSTLQRLQDLDETQRTELLAVATEALRRRLGLPHAPDDREAFLLAVLQAGGGRRR
jgi:uncharacterized RDD family membrane protein YckC